MALLEISLTRADGLRRAALGWALAVPWLRPVVIDKDRRVAAHAAILVVGAAFVALAVPVVPLVCAPLVLGVPHLASEVRWLVVRARLPVAFQIGLAGVALALATVAATDHVRAEGALGLSCIALAAGIAVHRASARWTLAALAAAAPAAAAAASASSTAVAVAVRDLVIASHGLVTFAMWSLVFRRSRRFALPASFALAVGLLAVSVVRGPLVAMAFLASVHYAAWLILIPSDAARGAGTPTFRMSFAGWKRDLGVPFLAGAAVVALVIAGAAIAKGAAPARDIYLVGARFHVWLEAAMACLLVARRRSAP